jgi:hypothetical protein
MDEWNDELMRREMDRSRTNGMGLNFGLGLWRLHTMPGLRL